MIHKTVLAMSYGKECTVYIYWNFIYHNISQSPIHITIPTFRNGDVTLHKEDPEEKNEFLKDLEKEEMSTSQNMEDEVFGKTVQICTYYYSSTSQKLN